MYTAEYWIKNLHLQAHPEGGFFRELYHSNESLLAKTLPERYSGDRSVYTSIYFLLTDNSFSAFHRLQSDELWHFYAGDPVHIYLLKENKELVENVLGPHASDGQVFQQHVPHSHWFGARVETPGSYALVGCTVSPGFDFDDFELADRETLSREYPSHTQLISELTR